MVQGLNRLHSGATYLTTMQLNVRRHVKENSMTTDKLLKTSEAATILGVSRYTLVNSYIKDGKLPAIRIGGENGHYRIRLSDLNRFMGLE